MNKHPVSFLQEAMARQKKSLPIYHMQEPCFRNGNRFQCFVSVDGIVVEGLGSSKPVAKENAASTAINRLGFKLTQPAPTSSPRIDYNAVGKLNELTAQKCLPYPQYDETGVNEVGHFIIHCSLHNNKTEGIASTKKEAKQIAAHNMLGL